MVRLDTAALAHQYRVLHIQRAQAFLMVALAYLAQQATSLLCSAQLKSVSEAFAELMSAIASQCFVRRIPQDRILSKDANVILVSPVQSPAQPTLHTTLVSAVPTTAGQSLAIRGVLCHALLAQLPAMPRWPQVAPACLGTVVLATNKRNPHPSTMDIARMCRALPILGGTVWQMAVLATRATLVALQPPQMHPTTRAVANRSTRPPFRRNPDPCASRGCLPNEVDICHAVNVGVRFPRLNFGDRKGRVGRMASRMLSNAHCHDGA